MAFNCQTRLEIALILTKYDCVCEDVASGFLEHLLWITYVMRGSVVARRKLGAPGRGARLAAAVMIKCHVASA